MQFWGQDVPGTSGPTRRDIPDPSLGRPGQKRYARRLLLRFWTGNGRDVPQFGSGRPGIRKTYARELWAGFSFPKLCRVCTDKAAETLAAPSRDLLNLMGVLLLLLLMQRKRKDSELVEDCWHGVGVGLRKQLGMLMCPDRIFVVPLVEAA